MTLPLDRLASNVSAPSPDKVAPPPAGTPTSCDDGRRHNLKRHRHRLRRRAGRIVGGRVCRCGQKMIGQQVALHRQDHGHHFSGLETCGSVWVCPVCAVGVTEGRRVELDAILKAHHAAGGDAYMATFTVPHHRFQSCRMLRRAVAASWRKVKNGRRWMEARNRFGWLGDVRALEVTHGDNGWHPHLHVLILFKPGTTKEQAYGMGGWLFDRWAAAVECMGLGQCSRDAFAYDHVGAAEGAAEYVSKWGASLELTKAHMKRARGGRTPWQILEDCTRGSRDAERDAGLFREYAAAFKGARQLTWSRGIRELYDTEPERSDEELATEPSAPETRVALVEKQLWIRIAHEGLTADVLTVADAGGVLAVVAFLRARGVPVWRSDSEDVPHLSLDPPRAPPWWRR